MNWRNKILALEQEKAKLERRINDLSFLFSVSTTLNSTYDLNSLLEAILSMAIKTTRSEGGSLFLAKRDGLDLLTTQGEGFKEINKYLGSSSYFVKKFLLRPQVLKITSAQEDFSSWQQLAPSLQSILLVPLRIENRLLGLLVLLHLHEGMKNHQGLYSEDDQAIISILAQQAALTWENTQLKIENERRSLYLETIQTLTSAIDAKDVYTRGHSQRVASLAVDLGKELRLTPEELDNLSYGAILHDIGKIGIKEEILNKLGKLTPEEFKIIQAHPRIGAEILELISFLQPSMEIARYHHERYDGQGYPDGLRGEDIPFTARIVALADAWDAMTSQRAYREALSWREACQEIAKGSGGQFDPYIAQAFLKRR